MAKGLQQRLKRPTQVIPSSSESIEENASVQKVTFSLHVKQIEMLEDFVYHAKKHGVRTNKSEVLRSLIELLPSINTENGNYRSMDEIKTQMAQALQGAAFSRE